MGEYEREEMRVEEQTESAYLSAIGLALPPDEQTLRRLLEMVVSDSDFRYEASGDGQGFCEREWYKLFGNGFGLAVYGSVRAGRSKPHVFVEDWTIFASGGQMNTADFFVDIGEDGRLYAFCEEVETGNEVEFRLTNQHDYDLYYRDGNPGEPLCVKNVELTAFACNGTILLPVERTEEGLAEREEEEHTRREMLARIRSGDKEAAAEMDEMFRQMNAVIEERLYEEDYLTVFESYLSPIEDKPCVYALLGDITAIREEATLLSDEAVLRLTVDVTGVPFQVLVGKNVLVGVPSVGMRLLSKVFIAGKANFIGAKAPRKRRRPKTKGEEA